MALKSLGTSSDQLAAGTTAQRPVLTVADAGSIRYNTELQNFEQWDGTKWTALASSVAVSESAPSNPSMGDLWWNADDLANGGGRLYVYYVDDTTSQWVDTSLPGGGGSTAPVDGANVFIGPAPPSGAEVGDLWWNSDETSNRLYVYYNDGQSTQWVETSPAADADAFLSKTNDDTAAGTIDFQAGLSVTGGTAADVVDGFYKDGGLVSIAHNSQAGFQFGGGGQVGYGVRLASGYQLSTSSTEVQPFRIIYEGTGHTTSQDYEGIRSSVNVDLTCENVSLFEAFANVAQTGANVTYSGFRSELNANMVTGSGSRAFNIMADGSAPNYFAGNVGIATDAPAAPLHINNPTSTAFKWGAVLGQGFDTDFKLVAASGNTATGDNAIVGRFGSCFSPNLWDSYIDFHRGAGSQGGYIKMHAGLGAYPVTVEKLGNFNVGILAGNGTVAVNVNNNGTLIAATSDRRKKENIADLPSAVETVKQLRPVSFNWIDKEEFGEQDELGFIAQEVEPLIPESVYKISNEEEDGEEIYGYKQATLIPVLTKALQEALEEIDSLKARLEALEGA